VVGTKGDLLLRRAKKELVTGQFYEIWHILFRQL